MADVLEKDIERRFRNLINIHGGHCLKWVCPGWSGVPDRIVLLPKGRIIFAEIKRPQGGKLSELQKYWAKKLMDLGFSYWQIWDEIDLAMFEQVELKGADL